MLPSLRSQIASGLSRALAVQGISVHPDDVRLEPPRQAAHGDVACNAAMQHAKTKGCLPRLLAEALAVALKEDPELNGVLAAVEVAGPGFLNLTLTVKSRAMVVREVLSQGQTFGQSHRGAGRHVVLEFVSANPTGPLHVGHGRQAALGDALAALLQADGWRVSREFYYNDAGAQINNLMRSVQARARGLCPEDPEFPSDGYRGEYIAEIAQAYLRGETVGAADVIPVTATGNPDDEASIRAFAVAWLRREQDADLKAFGVAFDRYYLESSLYSDGRVEQGVQALIASGHTYESEGALWLRTTAFGDDKDRVMRKSDGTYTYFVPDVAYHVTKFERGFDRAINIQGSDHHGTIARVRAGLQALSIGIPQGYPDYVLHKMVTVMRGGEEVKISKRAGSYVTVRDLIEWTGRDAVRFFLASRRADSEFTFDVDLALAQTDENPVYYVQYAFARVCSVLNQWGGDGTQLLSADLSILSGERERQLTQVLSAWPETISTAANELAPHHIAYYLRELAGGFHAYYNAERFLVDDEPTKLARLALITAVRQVLSNGMTLLGVSTPERM